MPNGFSGAQEKFDEIDALLSKLDPILETFIENKGMTLTKSNREWPDRDIRWGKGIEKLIQIYLDNEHEPLYNFWISASKDKGKKRYWKNIFLKKKVPFSDIENNITELLNEGYRILESWNETDLYYAGDIK